MTKEQQTPQVLEKLYNLTLNFVRKWAPRYYKQYSGDLEDLASEFYCQFLTPKSREGEKETLLDKYDVSKKPSSLSEDAFFANLVKVSVQRMLIDRSRADSRSTVSLDNFLETLGESVYKTFDLSFMESSDVDSIDIVALLPTLKERLKNISESQLINLKAYFSEVKNVLNPSFRKAFTQLLQPIIYIQTSVGELPLYQITPKTVCVLYNGAVVDFDRFTGLPRKNYPLQLLPKGIALVSELTLYKYPSSRDEFPLVYESVQ